MSHVSVDSAINRIDVLDFDTLDTKKYVQTVLDLSLKQPFFEDECSSKAVETEVLGLWQALGAVPALSSVLYPAIHDQFLAHAATMNDREIRIVASLLSGSLRESLSKKIVETIVELLRSEVHAGSDVGSLLQIVVEVLKSETPQRRVSFRRFGEYRLKSGYRRRS